MKYSKLFALAALALPMVAFAQTEVTFETQDYKSLGVYDTWEASPFRTGALSGNYAVIDNHLQYVDDQLGEAPNASSKILAVQRSRFGSNTFGVRVDLNTTFELTTTTKYLHVKVYRPYGGRVMVVGLGKRTERMDQSPQTEQFWAMSTTDIGADKWQDVVLPIKGNGGIDIYSLVVVPDCESPHNYTEDAICYIDDIKVNNDPSSELIYGYYQTAMGEEQEYTRSDRRLNSVKLQANGSAIQTISSPATPNTVYVDMTAEQLLVKAGETVIPGVVYTGGWMNAYAYVDYSNDGKFNANVNDDLSIAEGSDLVSFSFYGGTDDSKGVNSAGTTLTGNARNTLKMPSFKIPSDVKNGVYRMRYKVDWNSIDPAGCMDQSNSIIAKGGGIIDVMLNVHGDYCNVNDANRNGEVLSAVDGERLVTYQAPFGKEFRIRMNPENGFEYGGVIVKYGYNLQGDSIVNGNVQWQKLFLERQQFDENDEIVIPAKCMCGDVEIEGLFIEEGTYQEPEKPTRYTTTTIENGNFADGTTWYTIQIGQQGYVLTNGNANYIALDNTVVDIENKSHLWCFTGNDEDGYRLYNMQEGAGKVLAAPTLMYGDSGGSSFPTMQPVDAIRSGNTDLWMFENSASLGSKDVSHAYMYEKGTPSNKVNNRYNRLAFWTGGADSGSTLQIYYAKTTTGIDDIKETMKSDAIYDIKGNKVEAPVKGLYIVNGEKVYVK